MKTFARKTTLALLCIPFSFSVFASTSPDTSSVIRSNIEDMLSQKKNIAPLSDIPNGAENATLKDAAYFAWQEFIALNWASIKQEGKLGNRETADTNKKFGQAADASNQAYPALVWETFRHKVELYPGEGTPPGYEVTDNGPNQSSDFGYDILPAYNYSSSDSSITVPSGKTPWVNLDEISQIGTNQIYTGLPPNQSLNEGPGRLTLFLAKANRTEYQYIASRGWWSSDSENTYSPSGSDGNKPSTINRTASTIKSGKVIPAGNLIGSLKDAAQQHESKEYVSFPSDTIEIKTAWRLATKKEQQEHSKNGYVSGYHSNVIRYYEPKNKETSPDGLIAKDVLGVMQGLHIIHKTPSAPYFIFASFEHKDNIRRSDGSPLEDADGNILGTKPTTPTTSNVSTDVSHPQLVTIPPNMINSGQTINLLTQQTFTPSEDTPSSYTNNSQSYYINSADSGLASDSSSQPKIGVNKRRYDIPADIITINQDIHKLIKKSNTSEENPWSNYRLTNVQWKPVTKPAGQDFTESGDILPSTYYMSNSVIETNHILSKFSGQFFGNVSGNNNTITDYEVPQGEDNKGTVIINNTLYHKGESNGKTFKNVYHKGNGNLMGGCMGCHGNMQVAGNDFSFIFASRVDAPDAAPPAAISSDIALWNPNNGSALYTYYGEGNGSFENQTAWAWPAPPSAGQPFSGDFNGDGISDIGLWNPNKLGNAYIYYGKGDGSFQNQTAWNWPTSPQLGSVFTGDFNRDGFDDIGLWNPNNLSNAYIYYGEGNGSFQNQTTWNWPSSPTNGTFITSDFNNDGYSDVGLWNPNSQSNVYIHYGKGDGSFKNQTAWHWPSNAKTGQPFTGDFNSDGYGDFGLWNPNDLGNAYIYYGEGKGQFRDQTVWTWPGSPQAGTVITGHFN